MIVLVVLLSTGCSNLNEPVEKIKIVRVSIPDNLLVTCPKPTLDGEKISDIAVYAVKVTDQLKICNNRITQIKNLVKDYENEIKHDSSSNGRSGPRGRERGEPRDRGEPGNRGR